MCLWTSPVENTAVRLNNTRKDRDSFFDHMHMDLVPLNCFNFRTHQSSLPTERRGTSSRLHPLNCLWHLHYLEPRHFFHQLGFSRLRNWISAPVTRCASQGFCGIQVGLKIRQVSWWTGLWQVHRTLLASIRSLRSCSRWFCISLHLMQIICADWLAEPFFSLWYLFQSPEANLQLPNSFLQFAQNTFFRSFDVQPLSRQFSHTTLRRALPVVWRCAWGNLATGMFSWQARHRRVFARSKVLSRFCLQFLQLITLVFLSPSGSNLW